jgi:transposase-like protein
MRERKLEAWAEWRGLVSEQIESGKSVAAFCRERGLTVSQLFAWKKRLREAEAAKFVGRVAHP